MVYNEGLVGVWPLGGLESKCVVYKNIFDTPSFVCGGVFVKDAWLFHAVYICGVSRFPWFRQNQLVTVFMQTKACKTPSSIALSAIIRYPRHPRLGRALVMRAAPPTDASCRSSRCINQNIRDEVILRTRTKYRQHKFV